MFDPQCHYAILGLARSGIAAAYKIKELGATAFLSELRSQSEFHNAAELQRDFNCEFGGHTDKLMTCDTWIVSPGIPLDLPLFYQARQNGVKLISEIEFGWLIKHKDSRVIAVTGSNGKSTTASLIQHLLKNMGYRSILAGNIGSALCAHPIQNPGLDFLVLEVSSFQLDLCDSFKPDVAVLLNITPDHLNRYASFEDYISSKFRIFAQQTALDTAVVCIDSEPITQNLSQIRSRLRRYSLVQTPPETDAWLNRDAIQIGLRHKLPVAQLQIRGSHNYANTMAALLSVDSLTQDLTLAMEAAKSFQPLTHRLEFVADINGILFYNDSKATNCDSVKSALTAFDKPIRVIMGGSDKGEDYSVLTPLLRQWARKVYLTGDTAEKMSAAWQGQVDLKRVDDFADCLHQAFADSLPGDIIVLSPACASFDRFRNFEHRGDTFKELVRQLEAEHGKK